MLRTKPLNISFLLQNSAFELAHTNAASTQFLRTMEGLRSAGHEVSLLCLRSARKVIQQRNGMPSKDARLGWSQSHLFTLPEGALRRVQGGLSLPYLGILDSLRFRDACLRNLTGSDVLHERNSLKAFGAALASKKLGLPYVQFVDADFIFELDYLGIPLTGIERMVAFRAARFAFQTASVIICVSENAKKRLAQTYRISPEKIAVLPNAADIHRFRPRRDKQVGKTRLGVDGAAIVMFAGRFWPWHGVDLLVNAFQRTQKTLPAIHLVLVGDGITRPEVEKQVRALDITKSVTFTGTVAHEEMPQMLAAADVVVAPYPQEPPGGQWQSPMKVFEYMASGKAIVASRVGQVADVIEDGENGILVEPGDPVQLSDALIRLLQNPAERKRLGTNARQQAVANHSWEKYIQQLEDIYYHAIYTSKQRQSKTRMTEACEF
jgi:glycosyltransferase involved in cell wall biosynthesis